MKPSHLTTPRTMSDGVWIASADPLDFPHQREPRAWTAVDVLIALLALATLAAICLEVL